MVIGALGSSYVNAGNLGIPLAVYVFGDASYVAPVMLYQLVVLAPISFVVLDMVEIGTPSVLASGDDPTGAQPGDPGVGPGHRAGGHRAPRYPRWSTRR